MKFLIIGSEGFIGKNIYNYFSKNNECYRADVINSTNDDKYFKLNKINPDFLSIFEKVRFDICINASGSANVGLSIEEPVLDSVSNYLTVECILSAIVRTKQNCKFILLSSAAVYGNPQTLPIQESTQINPLSPYGYHKFFAEQTCIMYNKLYGVNTYCLRLFSVYGVGQKKQLLWDLMKKFTTDDVVQLFGTGKESRDFINVFDVVQSIKCIINSSEQNGIFNIANGIQIYISDIANLIKKILGSSKKIVFSKQIREGDPINWEADISKIRKIGYSQSISFENGVNTYVKWGLNEI